MESVAAVDGVFLSLISKIPRYSVCYLLIEQTDYLSLFKLAVARCAVFNI